MRISGLSRISGVPVATIKYYLRAGLLPDGERTSATQARYDESHLARLRLIRALIGVGELSVATTREVLAQLDQPQESMHDLLGTVHHLLGPPAGASAEPDTGPAESVIAELGWQVDQADPEPLRRLAAALSAITAADFPLSRETVLDYARAMREVAEREVEGVPEEPGDAAVRYVVLGTILVEPLLLALRRLAQIDASARSFGAGGAE